MKNENEVWFEIGQMGIILFTMGDIEVGAVDEDVFGVASELDDEFMRKFREGIVSLYKAVPDLEQEIIYRLADANLAEAEPNLVSRFMRALAPLSNLDFEPGYFDRLTTTQLDLIEKLRKVSKKRNGGTDFQNKVIPFPGRPGEEK